MTRAILTIDDGPSPITPGILDFLGVLGVPAVMFFQGSQIERHPAIARAACRAGVAIGNHGYSHRAFSGMSLAEAAQEIDHTQSLIDAIHADAGLAAPKRHFRFPYGDQGGALAAGFQDLLRTRGYQSIVPRAPHLDALWTHDLQDYRLSQADGDFTPDDIVCGLDGRFGRDRAAGPGAVDTEVLIMHDHPLAHERFPHYYRHYLRRTLELGFRFVLA
jgi:peptidoglycan/xylan/chitin deacetylase (PgdA/CDA1 family)